MGLSIACSGQETRRLLGMGTDAFRQQGQTQAYTFNHSLDTCYERTLGFIKGLGATHYRGTKQKQFIVAMNFSDSFGQCHPATEVAIFFTALGENRTRVEISSLNHSLAEFVSEKLLETLGG